MTEGVYECPVCYSMNCLPEDTEEVFEDLGRPKNFNVSAYCPNCGTELVIPITVRFSFEVDEDYEIQVQEEE